MKQKLVYCCEFCGFESSYHDVVRHEAAHYGLTAEEYEEWMRLDVAVKKASYYMGQQRDRRMEAILEDAIGNMLDFEKEHGLEGKRLPIH